MAASELLCLENIHIHIYMHLLPFLGSQVTNNTTKSYVTFDVERTRFLRLVLFCYFSLHIPRFGVFDFCQTVGVRSASLLNRRRAKVWYVFSRFSFLSFHCHSILPLHFDSLKYHTLEICLAAKKVSRTETILGAQEIRGLWRVYPLTRTARNKLLIDNLTLRQKTVEMYGKNPFIVRGGSGEEVPATKVWISDIPISVGGKDIETALVRLGCVLKSSLIKKKEKKRKKKRSEIRTGN